MTKESETHDKNQKTIKVTNNLMQFSYYFIYIFYTSIYKYLNQFKF